MLRHVSIALAGLLAVAAAAHAGTTLYGITGTNLVIINPDPVAGVNSVTVVGAHNIAAIQPSPNLGNLTYNPLDGYLYGWVSNPIATAYSLYRIDRTTGAASLAASFSSSLNHIDTIEYVDSQGSMVISRDPLGNQASFDVITLATNGAAAGLVTYSTSVDQDSGAYDSTRDQLYTWDPNSGGNPVYLASLTGGGVSVVGTTSPTGPELLGDGAYLLDHDAIVAVDYTANTGSAFFNRLYRVIHAGSYDMSTVGSIEGDMIFAIAAVNEVPEPAAFAALFIGGAALLRRRSR